MDAQNIWINPGKAQLLRPSSKLWRFGSEMLSAVPGEGVGWVPLSAQCSVTAGCKINAERYFHFSPFFWGKSRKKFNSLDFFQLATTGTNVGLW